MITSNFTSMSRNQCFVCINNLNIECIIFTSMYETQYERHYKTIHS